MSLERDLRQLGEQVLPPTPDLVGAVMAKIEVDAVADAGGYSVTRRRPLGRLLQPAWATAIVLAVLIVAVLAIPPAREAVADWLGIGQVRVEQVPELPPVTTVVGPDLGETLNLGIAVPVPAAPLPDALGPPESAYEDERGTTTYVWLPSATLPEVGASGVGALLSTFVDDGIPVAKQVAGDTELVEVTVDGQPGLWIVGGPHVVFFDGGNTYEGRLAGNTLLWERDGLTYRLEIAVELEAALAIAESLS